MMKFLANLVIKTPREYDDPATRRAYGVLCGALSKQLKKMLFKRKIMAA